MSVLKFLSSLFNLRQGANPRQRAIRSSYDLSSGVWIDLHYHPEGGTDTVTRYKVISVDRQTKEVFLRPERPAKQQEDITTDRWSMAELGIVPYADGTRHPAQYITISSLQR